MNDKITIKKGIDYYPRVPFDTNKIHSYLNGITTWKGGTKADGSEIKRLQLWYDKYNRYFSSNEWNNLKIDRWKSSVYDDFLLSCEQDVQHWADNNMTDAPKLNINSVLINKYRNGDDYIKRHRDSTVFGDSPTILNLSIGGPRDIVFTENATNKNIKVTLYSGSMLVMHGNSQSTNVHEIPRSKTQNNVRYSLTWREKLR